MCSRVAWPEQAEQQLLSGAATQGKGSGSAVARRQAAGRRQRAARCRVASVVLCVSRAVVFNNTSLCVRGSQEVRVSQGRWVGRPVRGVRRAAPLLRRR